MPERVLQPTIGQLLESLRRERRAKRVAAQAPRRDPRASPSETGWPYVQHRGGAAGFLTVIEPGTIAFADYQGTRQHISKGNLASDPRVSLILMDCPNQQRLKILGRAKIVPWAEVDDALRKAVHPPGRKGKPERVIVIDVAGFDWNCPQHVTQRFTLAEVTEIVTPLRERIAELELRLALSLAIPAASPVRAATYHVAIGGSDAAAGDAAAPWASIQHAVDSVAPGDTIIVHPGTFAGCRIERSGTQVAPCTLMAETPLAALINAPGPRNRHQSHLEVELFGTTITDWIIDGFEVSGGARYGIDMRDVDRLTVTRCNVHGSAVTGIFDGFAYHPRYEDNESWNNGEHGIYHSNSGDDGIIRGNRLHHNAASGLHMNGDISLGGDGTISRMLVEKNVIWENGMAGGSGINCDGVTDSIIRNNLLYDNHASGIALFGIDGAVGSSRNLVANNTIVQAADNRSRWVINMSDFGGASPPVGNRILNNILYTPRATRGSVDIWDPAAQGFVSDYNVVVDRFSPDSENSTISLAQWQALGHDLNSFIATPAQLCVDPVAHDYRLRVGSPAIDMGTAVPEVTEDLWGDARPQGARWDIGADELIGCAAPGLVTGLLMGADRQTSTWQAAVGADSYDVVRGDLLALLVARGDFSVSIAACVENDGVDLIATDASLPLPGGALYWLVRATACGLPGSWDSGAASQPTSRDASIASAPSACP